MWRFRWHRTSFNFIAEGHLCLPLFVTKGDWGTSGEPCIFAVADERSEATNHPSRRHQTPHLAFGEWVLGGPYSVVVRAYLFLINLIKHATYQKIFLYILISAKLYMKCTYMT